MISRKVYGSVTCVSEEMTRTVGCYASNTRYAALRIPHNDRHQPHPSVCRDHDSTKHDGNVANVRFPHSEGEGRWLGKVSMIADTKAKERKNGRFLSENHMTLGGFCGYRF